MFNCSGSLMGHLAGGGTEPRLQLDSPVFTGGSSLLTAGCSRAACHH